MRCKKQEKFSERQKISAEMMKMPKRAAVVSTRTKESCAISSQIKERFSFLVGG
jgi:hypothetical protein